jgi:hypothetical protein
MAPGDSHPGMGSTTPPATAAAEAGSRRTRPTDAWTTLFFGLTATLGAWSLVLIGLTLTAIVDPSYDADDDTFDLKTVGSLTVAAIAMGQAFTMGAAMGKVPRLGLSMRVLMRTHRRVGRIGLALAGVVAFLCWRASGGPPTPEGIVHGALASSGFLAIAFKFALLKWRPALAFGAAPWLGVYGALAFILVAVSAMLGDDLLELDEDFFERGEDGGDEGRDGGD